MSRDDIRALVERHLDAINRHDGPEIVSIVTVLVVIYVFVNLLIDLLYGVLDPRIRYVK